VVVSVQHLAPFDQSSIEQQNSAMADGDRSHCSKCGTAVRNTAKRDGRIFFICDNCGLRGHPRGSRAVSIRAVEDN
jgi:predicted RNA-binding Zn-ribbon protein involved in translation (DUF1610 family)